MHAGVLTTALLFICIPQGLDNLLCICHNSFTNPIHMALTNAWLDGVLTQLLDPATATLTTMDLSARVGQAFAAFQNLQPGGALNPMDGMHALTQPPDTRLRTTHEQHAFRSMSTRMCRCAPHGNMCDLLSLRLLLIS